MYEALIAPSETPTPLRDIKRALITYDKIKLIDPNDREIIPRDNWGPLMLQSMGFPTMPMAFSMGPVKPLGKISGYDDTFQKTVDDCKLAINDNLIEVISTYKEDNRIKFPPTQFPLNPAFVVNVYQNICKHQDFLKKAIQGDLEDLIRLIEKEESIAIAGHADGGLPYIDDLSLTNEQAHYLTLIAHARIASFVKFSGFCEKKKLIPIFPSYAYGNIAMQLLNNTRETLLKIEDNSYWFKKNRLLNLCHEEYIDDEKLDNLSIKDIIKLRTTLWEYKPMQERNYLNL